MRGLAALVLATTAATAAQWRPAARVPLARTEVAGARFGNDIVVVGGYTADGATSARVDAFSPSRNSWRRLPDLPAAANHAMAAGSGGRVYVVGGYSATGERLRTGFVFSGRAWRSLPSLPEGRAAAGAAIAGGKLYVIGGVRPRAPRLARVAFVLNLRTRRWSTIPGPIPREHLAVTATRGRVYALAGRTGGDISGLRTFQVYDGASRRWRSLPPVPEPRGGTGAAAVGRTIVSVGGEAPQGTLAKVFGFDVVTHRWRRLADLPTPRHGLGVVAFGKRVYAIAGGPQPGLHVSDANEYLTVP